MEKCRILSTLCEHRNALLEAIRVLTVAFIGADGRRRSRLRNTEALGSSDSSIPFHTFLSFRVIP